MAPQYKLFYFDLRGIAEPIRLLLNHAGIEFEDERVAPGSADWQARKKSTEWGKVPTLQDGDFNLSQSSAILRYLAEKHGYLPSDPKEAAKADEYVGAMLDYVELATKSYFVKDPTEKALIEKDFKDNIAPVYVMKLEEILKKSEGGFLLGDKVTYADFVVAHYMFQSLKADPNCLQEYPVLAKYVDQVHGLDGVKEWVAKRPVTEW